MQQILAIVSGVLVLAAAPPYLLDIFHRKTLPQRTTWLIWSLLSTIAFFAQFQLHGGWSLIFLGIDAVIGLTIFALSLHYGVGGRSRLDTIVLIIAGAGLLISLLAHQPVIAIIGVVIADVAGLVPTIHKTYRLPDSETSITWFLVATASLLSAFVVPEYAFGLLLYPIYLAVGNFSVLLAQWLGRRVEIA